MSSPATNRRELLRAHVQANPGDAFARYGLAMDLVNSGESEAALAEFAALAAANPDYVPGYQQWGQLLHKLERFEEARAILNKGIAAAHKTGNAHAASEMQGLIDEMSLG